MENEKILIIAPHPDDETLGLGGTISKLSKNNDVFILVVSGHLPPLYSNQDYLITENEAKRAFKILGVKNFDFLKIPATKVSDLPIYDLNKIIYNFFQIFKPSVVFCPFPDRHIDHKLIFESVMVCSRPIGIGKNIKIFGAYETLSETHWNAPDIEPNFVPNMIIDISDFIKIKLKALAEYKSQITKFPGPRSIEAVESLAKFRGTQSGFAYGEGVKIIRMII